MYAYVRRVNFVLTLTIRNIWSGVLQISNATQGRDQKLKDGKLLSRGANATLPFRQANVNRNRFCMNGKILTGPEDEMPGQTRAATDLHHEADHEDHSHAGDDVRMVLYDELVAEDRRVLARALASLHRYHLGRRERVRSLRGERGTTDGGRTRAAPPRGPGHAARKRHARAYAAPRTHTHPHAAANRANAVQCGVRSLNPLAPRASY